MEWKFSKDSITKKDIETVEKYLGVSLPERFKEIIVQHNGARPSLSYFDLEKEKEKVFDSLINYKLNTENNVIDYYDSIKNEIAEKIIPFGEDPFGNLLGFLYKNKANPSIIFYNHEISNEKISVIADNFDDFINKLY